MALNTASGVVIDSELFNEQLFWFPPQMLIQKLGVRLGSYFLRILDVVVHRLSDESCLRTTDE